MTAHTKPGISLRDETRALLQLALPLLVAQLALIGTGVVDTIMAGRYSSIDLVAIAIGYNIWLPIYLISLGIMLAVTSIVAQHFGAGRIEALRKCLPQAVCFNAYGYECTYTIFSFFPKAFSLLYLAIMLSAILSIAMNLEQQYCRVVRYQ